MTLALGGAAFAHTGVQNPAVLVRMENMTAIADEMEILVNMARGRTAYDETLAETARDRLHGHAGEVVALFEAPETDPRMEALPIIWEDFADFSSKAADLERAALGLSGRLASREDVVAAVRALGATCTACHDAYRVVE
jgi:cytochrome c556